MQAEVQPGIVNIRVTHAELFKQGEHFEQGQNGFCYVANLSVKDGSSILSKCGTLPAEECYTENSTGSVMLAFSDVLRFPHCLIKSQPPTTEKPFELSIVRRDLLSGRDQECGVALVPFGTLIKFMKESNDSELTESISLTNRRGFGKKGKARITLKFRETALDERNKSFLRLFVLDAGLSNLPLSCFAVEVVDLHSKSIRRTRICQAQKKDRNQTSLWWNEFLEFKDCNHASCSGKNCLELRLFEISAKSSTLIAKQQINCDSFLGRDQQIQLSIEGKEDQTYAKIRILLMFPEMNVDSSYCSELEQILKIKIHNVEGLLDDINPYAVAQIFPLEVPSTSGKASGPLRGICRTSTARQGTTKWNETMQLCLNSNTNAPDILQIPSLHIGLWNETQGKSGLIGQNLISLRNLNKGVYDGLCTWGNINLKYSLQLIASSKKSKNERREVDIIRARGLSKKSTGRFFIRLTKNQIQWDTEIQNGPAPIWRETNDTLLNSRYEILTPRTKNMPLKLDLFECIKAGATQSRKKNDGIKKISVRQSKEESLPDKAPNSKDGAVIVDSIIFDEATVKKLESSKQWLDLANGGSILVQIKSSASTLQDEQGKSMGIKGTETVKEQLINNPIQSIPIPGVFHAHIIEFRNTCSSPSVGKLEVSLDNTSETFQVQPDNLGSLKFSSPAHWSAKGNSIPRAIFSLSLLDESTGTVKKYTFSQTICPFILNAGQPVECWLRDDANISEMLVRMVFMKTSQPNDKKKGHKNALSAKQRNEAQNALKKKQKNALKLNKARLPNKSEARDETSNPSFLKDIWNALRKNQSKGLSLHLQVVNAYLPNVTELADPTVEITIEHVEDISGPMISRQYNTSVDNDGGSRPSWNEHFLVDFQKLFFNPIIHFTIKQAPENTVLAYSSMPLFSAFIDDGHIIDTRIQLIDPHELDKKTGELRITGQMLYNQKKKVELPETNKLESQNNLIVTVFGARNLKQDDWLGSIDAFVSLKVMDDKNTVKPQIFNTKSIAECSNEALWNESFKFYVPECETKRNCRLSLQIHNENTIASESIIAHESINLNRILKNDGNIMDEWLPLNNGRSGEIRIIVHYGKIDAWTSTIPGCFKTQQAEKEDRKTTAVGAKESFWYVKICRARKLRYEGQRIYDAQVKVDLLSAEEGILKESLCTKVKSMGDDIIERTKTSFIFWNETIVIPNGDDADILKLSVCGKQGEMIGIIRDLQLSSNNICSPKWETVDPISSTNQAKGAGEVELVLKKEFRLKGKISLKFLKCTLLSRKCKNLFAKVCVQPTKDTFKTDLAVIGNENEFRWENGQISFNYDNLISEDEGYTRASITVILYTDDPEEKHNEVGSFEIIPNLKPETVEMDVTNSRLKTNEGTVSLNIEFNSFKSEEKEENEVDLNTLCNIRKLKAFFYKLDSNHSGTVDRNEFEDGLKNQPGLQKLLKNRMEFSQLDADGDGTLTWTEFSNALVLEENDNQQDIDIFETKDSLGDENLPASSDSVMTPKPPKPKRKPTNNFSKRKLKVKSSCKKQTGKPKGKFAFTEIDDPYLLRQRLEEMQEQINVLEAKNCKLAAENQRIKARSKLEIKKTTELFAALKKESPVDKFFDNEPLVGDEAIPNFQDMENNPSYNKGIPLTTAERVNAKQLEIELRDLKEVHNKQKIEHQLQNEKLRSKIDKKTRKLECVMEEHTNTLEKLRCEQAESNKLRQSLDSVVSHMMSLQQERNQSEGKQRWKRAKLLAEQTRQREEEERLDQERKNKMAAVVLLQARVRAFRYRKRYVKLMSMRSKAATSIQSRVRGRRGSLQYAETLDKRNKSSIQIQKLYRGKLERQNLQKQNEAANTLQAIVRGQKGRVEADGVRLRRKSSVVLQQMARRKIAKDELSSRRAQREADIYAAIVIQSRYRKHSSKRVFSEKREERAVEEYERTAATTMQRSVRGRLGRQKTLQARQSLKEKDKAATLVQKHVRKRNAQREFEQRQRTAMKESLVADRIEYENQFNFSTVQGDESLPEISYSKSQLQERARSLLSGTITEAQMDVDRKKARQDCKDLLRSLDNRNGEEESICAVQTPINEQLIGYIKDLTSS